jgi:hypothetical protein
MRASLRRSSLPDVFGVRSRHASTPVDATSSTAMIATSRVAIRGAEPLMTRSINLRLCFYPQP